MGLPPVNCLSENEDSDRKGGPDLCRATESHPPPNNAKRREVGKNPFFLFSISKRALSTLGTNLVPVVGSPSWLHSQGSEEPGFPKKSRSLKKGRIGRTKRKFSVVKRELERGTFLRLKGERIDSESKEEVRGETFIESPRGGRRSK